MYIGNSAKQEGKERYGLDHGAAEKEILEELKECVLAKMRFESEKVKKLVLLHKKWICMTWAKYTAEAHKGVAAMYTADERFRQYYDSKVPGCAEFLKRAIEYWADKL